jgi:DNA repair photolyase
MDQDHALITRASTPEGRAASSQNARRYGLHTRAIVIPGVESEDDWRDFHENVFASLAPEGAVEATLAHRVAALLWRINRIPRAERDAIAERQAHEDAEAERRGRVNEDFAKKREALKDKNLGFYGDVIREGYNPLHISTLRRVLPDDAQLQQISRYEAHLGRQLRDAMHELEAMQARRNGTPSSLARLDVHVTRGE